MSRIEDQILVSKRRTIDLTMRRPSEIIRAVGTVTQQQHQQIERLAARTESATGDLLRLARECAQDGSLVDIAQLDRFAAADVIETLEKYDYYRRLAIAA